MEHRPFKTVYEVDHAAHQDEVFTLPSQTVPDQSLSIKDILYRFSQGLPLDVNCTPLPYGDDVEMYDDDNFDVHPANQFGHDLVDMYEMKEAADNVLARAQSVAKQGKSENATTINDDANKDDPASPVD